MNNPHPSENKSNKTYIQKLFAFSPAGLFRLFLASLGVGVVLAVLDIDPRRVWVDFFGTISDAWQTVWEMADWAVDYLVLGAILVVPVAVILRIFGATRKK